MSKCQHARVQQFTEICLDCGANIYEKRVLGAKTEVVMLQRKIDEQVSQGGDLWA